MDFVDRIRQYTEKQAAALMIDLLSYVSQENFIRLSYLAERVVHDESNKAIVRKIRDALMEGEDSVASQSFRRVMTQLDPAVLRRFGKTLFIRGFLESANMRDKFEQEHGFRPPFTMLISPTMRCNLRCKGCYSGLYPQEKGLEFDLLDRILTEARDIGICFVAFSGGEPLMRKKDLFTLIERHEDMYFMFYTNGTLIDKDVAARLRDLGNVAAIISLEGFKEATDDRRGPGVFDRIVRAMDLLRDEGLPFGSSLTVTRGNAYTLLTDEFVDFLIDKGVLIVWLFLFMPVGKDPDVSLMPTPEQREFIRQRDKEIRATRPIFIADFWNDAPAVGGCIAGGRQYIHINSNGDVEPCVFTHFAIDNIKDKSLVEVLDSEFFRSIRSKQPYSENLLTPCMIIDNPNVYRDLVRSCGAYPTHEGAEHVVTRIAKELDEYGCKVRALEDRIWREEYAEEQQQRASA
ncbi:MAG: radical SAM protein [Deltaproteobacteria bacterium]|nr:radical SAM protein [Deltaproteobacteria bacterium]MBW2308620.1 radical SAM protein [Deltaproteobacteria bacterium]